MATTAKPCKAVTRKGQPCAAYAVGGGDFCYWHDPGSAETRRAARSAGGHARHGRTIGRVAGDLEPVTLRTVADVLALLERTANDLLTLENSINRGRAVTAVCATFAKCYEVSELGQRLAALEATLRIREVGK